MKSTALASSWLVKIEEKFLLAEDHHIEAGLSWYDNANTWVTMTSLNYDVPADKVAKIVAVLSPGSKWERNKRDAWLLLSWANLTEEQITNLPFGTYKANVRKAWRVYHDLEDLLPKSQKTFAFYRNIMLDPDHVTVDRHAITAIGGVKFLNKIASKSASGAYSLTEYRYKKAADAYKNMANKYNLTPYQLQAIVWMTETERKLANKKTKGE
jgi:hypothetical protein